MLVGFGKDIVAEDMDYSRDVALIALFGNYYVSQLWKEWYSIIYAGICDA